MKTKLTELLGIKYPVIQGGMAWTSDAVLAAAVSNAGGAGIIGSGGREQITVSFSNHVLSFVCTNPACIRLWPRRGVCRRSGSTVRTVKLLSRLLPAASA